MSLLDRTECEAADELPLRQPAKYQDRRNGERRCGRKLRPKQPLRTRIRGDKCGERRGLRRGEIERPEGFVPSEDHVEKKRRGDPGQCHWREHEHDFTT